MKKFKQFLFNHPYGAGILAWIYGFLMVQIVGGGSGIIIADVIGLDREMVTEVTVLILAIFMLIFHCLWLKKNGFKGAFASSKFSKKDVWGCIFIMCLIDFGPLAMSLALGEVQASDIVIPSLFTVIMALCAGLNEEVINRLIPLTFMMKNKPTSKRIMISAILTSLAFGVVHMVNLLAGAPFAITLVQICFAFSIGLFFAAIYLRTGSILIPIIFHGVHDLQAFLTPGQSDGIMTIQSFTFMQILPTFILAGLFVVLALIMLRKSKMEEIKQTWANIWSE